jgi:hypothetical protein
LQQGQPFSIFCARNCVKINISEAGLYNIIPNIPFAAISARCFIILLF